MDEKRKAGALPKWRCFAVALATLWLASQSVEAAELVVVKGEPTAIRLSGEILPLDAARFVSLAQSEKPKRLYLASGGGSLEDSMSIGNFVRLARIETVVDENASCASGCSLIWLAGTSRVIMDGGRIGFHAALETENSKATETGRVNAVVGAYLARLGYSDGLIWLEASAHPPDIKWFTARDMVNLGVPVTSLLENAKGEQALDDLAKEPMK